MTHLLLLIVAYLLGSIPVGLILARFAGIGDLRKVGSGNIGATNALRAGGFGLAFATWIGDMAKAVAAVILGREFFGADFGALCGLVAVIGHIYPVWLGFKGGKGISSMFGFMLGLSPVGFVVGGISWLLVALGTGYSSAGALVFLALMPIFGFAVSFGTGIICIAMAVLGYYRHKENIARLRSGKESKIKWRKK